MEAIAARAGVSAQTVYNQFGTKSELLAAVLDRAIAGDASPVAVIERPWFVVGDAEPAADAIARFAAAGTAILARVAPLYDVIRSASALPEVRRLLDDNRRRRRADQRHLVGALAATGQLRPDLDADHAADVVYGLVNEDVYLLLTADCGWSRKRFATWLAETLLDQLVTTPDRAGRRTPAQPLTAQIGCGMSDQVRSKRSRFITLFQAAAKSRANFSFPSADAYTSAIAPEPPVRPEHEVDRRRGPLDGSRPVGAPLVDGSVRRRRLLLHPHLEQVHEEVIGQRTGSSVNTPSGDPPRWCRAHAYRRWARHVRRRQREQVRPLEQQRLGRQFSPPGGSCETYPVGSTRRTTPRRCRRATRRCGPTRTAPSPCTPRVAAAFSMAAPPASTMRSASDTPLCFFWIWWSATATSRCRCRLVRRPLLLRQQRDACALPSRRRARRCDGTSPPMPTRLRPGRQAGASFSTTAALSASTSLPLIFSAPVAPGPAIAARAAPQGQAVVRRVPCRGGATCTKHGRTRQRTDRGSRGIAWRSVRRSGRAAARGPSSASSEQPLLRVVCVGPGAKADSAPFAFH